MKVKRTTCIPHFQLICECALVTLFLVYSSIIWLSASRCLFNYCEYILTIHSGSISNFPNRHLLFPFFLSRALLTPSPPPSLSNWTADGKYILDHLPRSIDECHIHWIVHCYTFSIDFISFSLILHFISIVICVGCGNFVQVMIGMWLCAFLFWAHAKADRK